MDKFKQQVDELWPFYFSLYDVHLITLSEKWMILFLIVGANNLFIDCVKLC